MPARERRECAADPDVATRPSRSAAALAAGLLAAGGLGHTAYAAYPRFNLPALDLGFLLLFAVGAGVASFFSPCIFALLAAAALTPRAGRRVRALRGFRGPADYCESIGYELPSAPHAACVQQDLHWEQSG